MGNSLRMTIVKGKQLQDVSSVWHMNGRACGVLERMAISLNSSSLYDWYLLAARSSCDSTESTASFESSSFCIVHSGLTNQSLPAQGLSKAYGTAWQVYPEFHMSMTSFPSRFSYSSTSYASPSASPTSASPNWSLEFVLLGQAQE